MVPATPDALDSISTAGWCQLFQCALHLEVGGCGRGWVWADDWYHCCEPQE